VSQLIHQEILSKIDNNFFHVVLVGFNLRDYQSRLGKIKKFVRYSHHLIEIELGKPVEGQFGELRKYLNQ
jgi:hypothetical protein